MAAVQKMKTDFYQKHTKTGLVKSGNWRISFGNKCG